MFDVFLPVSKFSDETGSIAFPMARFENIITLAINDTKAYCPDISGEKNALAKIMSRLYMRTIQLIAKRFGILLFIIPLKSPAILLLLITSLINIKESRKAMVVDITKELIAPVAPSPKITNKIPNNIFRLESLIKLNPRAQNFFLPCKIPREIGSIKDVIINKPVIIKAYTGIFKKSAIKIKEKITNNIKRRKERMIDFFKLLMSRSLIFPYSPFTLYLLVYRETMVCIASVGIPKMYMIDRSVARML